MIDDRPWYGMTKDEASARCRRMGRSCHFIVTKDPRIDPDRDRAGVAGRGDPVAKVIRAKEEADGITFLLGYFAPYSDPAPSPE